MEECLTVFKLTSSHPVMVPKRQLTSYKSVLRAYLKHHASKSVSIVLMYSFIFLNHMGMVFQNDLRSKIQIAFSVTSYISQICIFLGRLTFHQCRDLSLLFLKYLSKVTFILGINSIETQYLRCVRRESVYF